MGAATLLGGNGNRPPRDDEPTVISSEPPLAAPHVSDAPRPGSLGGLLPGDRLEHFELLEYIGGGGMGRVFRARDTRLDRVVALKVLAPSQAGDGDALARFRNEAQSAARLDHENVARVFHVGEDHGLHYIAFEFIEGVNLRVLVHENGPLSISDAISYTLQVAEALAHAASRDVVHRDIKPSNVLVMPSGRAKLIDMGLARLHKIDTVTADLTASGVTLGTFDYISPEQARDPRNADVRSDIYSLGCTLFYMLAGRPPFPEGTVLQKLLQHQGDEPPDVRQFRPDTPDGLLTVLRRMMAKDPRNRYQAATELLDDLSSLARQLGLRPWIGSSRAWETAPRPRISRWAHHMPWLAPTAALLCVVAALHVLGGSEAPPPPILGGPEVLVELPDPAEFALPAASDSATHVADMPQADTGALPQSGDAAALPTEGSGPGGIVPGENGQGSLPALPAPAGSAPASPASPDPVAAAPAVPPATGPVMKAPVSAESVSPAPIAPPAAASAVATPGMTAPNPAPASGQTVPDPPEPIDSVATQPASTQPAMGEPGTVAPAAGATSPASLPPGAVAPAAPLLPGASDLGAETEREAGEGGAGAAPSAGEPASVLVVNGGDATAGGYPSLAGALAAAENGSVIELRYNGPRELAPLKLAGRRLAIRGGDGFRPVVQFQLGAGVSVEPPQTMIAVASGEVEFADLAVEFDVSRKIPAEKWSLFEIAGGAKILVRRCSLSVHNASDAGTAYHPNVAVFRTRPAAGADRVTASPTDAPTLPATIELVDCSVRGQAALLRAEAFQPADFRWNHGFFATSEPVVSVAAGAHAPSDKDVVTLNLRHLTALLGNGLLAMNDRQPPNRQIPVAIELSDSILVGSAGSPLLEQHAEAGADPRSKVRFRGNRNFYERIDLFWRVQGNGDARPPVLVDFDAWQAHWGGDENLAKVNRVAWRKAPPEQAVPHRVRVGDVAIDFDLPDNPARGTAGNGRDAGADPARLPEFPSP